MLKNFEGLDGFIWARGVIEARDTDPLYLGRCKVRWFGWNSPDKQAQPTEDLPWAYPMLPLDHGQNTIGPREGDWVVGFFLDGKLHQKPVMIGIVPGIPEEVADPETGFNDPTPNEKLDPTIVPRPPFMDPTLAELIAQDPALVVAQDALEFSAKDPNVLPGTGTAFGVLKSEYIPTQYPYDMNRDGKYNWDDAEILAGEAKSSFFVEDDTSIASPQSYAVSRYPLEPFLREPTTSIYARGEEGSEKIKSESIVALKNADLKLAEAGGHFTSGVGTDYSEPAEPFLEPPSPYDAKYPYNHAYYSESGHLRETDDTPGAQRLHEYHRSGTFREDHPNGTQVFKTIGNKYEFIYKEWNALSLRNINITAEESIRLKSKLSMNLNTELNLNRDVGRNLNTNVLGDMNTKITRDGYIVIKGDCKIMIEGNLELYGKQNIHIKAEREILMDAPRIRTHALTINEVNAGLAVLTNAPITFFDSQLATGNFVRAHYTDVADQLGFLPIPPIFAPVPIPAVNQAGPLPDTTGTFAPPEAPAAIKPGYILDGPEIGYLYKPVSESDGKLVTLSPENAVHELYEAIPTGELEEVTIQYFNANATITSWNVVRPKHKRGQLIERGKFSGIANGDRAHYRWSRAGAAYPKHMFWVIGGSKEWFIISSGERHD